MDHYTQPEVSLCLDHRRTPVCLWSVQTDSVTARARTQLSASPRQPHYLASQERIPEKLQAVVRWAGREPNAGRQPARSGARGREEEREDGAERGGTSHRFITSVITHLGTMRLGVDHVNRCLRVSFIKPDDRKSSSLPHTTKVA